MNDYGAIAVELLVGFCALFLYTKLVGKTHFSQLTPFDFISVLILGELLGNAVYDQEIKLQKILFALSLWALLIYVTELVTQKLKSTRKMLEGQPSILIRKGNIQFKEMKKIKLDLNQLQSLLRQQGYFSLREVNYVIMETNGSISVLPKPEYGKPTNQDLHLHPQPSSLPYTVILDGEVIHDNLRASGHDEQWLKDELANADIFHYQDVLFAEWRENEPLFLQKYS
ncbi:DUF421 domain-containing protein [Xylanibacillus composti]|nr:DUF421 domain-containing protein [Xylanibacillus composti]MDT9726061.1 DUF421 domain-containing protein [Xylanibacillus composti]